MIGIVLIFICGWLSVFFHFNQFLWNSPPTLLGIVTTVAYLLCWASVGAFMGWKEKKLFNLVSIFYWCIGIFAYIIGSHFPRSILYSIYAFVVLMCFGPLYGLAYYLPIHSYFVLTIILAFIPISLSLLSYFIGRGLKLRYNK